MVGVARRILFRQDLAEEAVHDAFIRIWRGAAGFDPHRGSARGWLYAVVRNRALSIHRNEHRYESPTKAPRISTAKPPCRECRKPARCADALSGSTARAAMWWYSPMFTG